MSALEIKWGAPTYPRKFGCWFKAASFVVGPLLQDGVQWGNDPTPDEQRLAAARWRKDSEESRRRKSGGDSNA